MLKQRTIASPTSAVGVGLHSGQRVELFLSPAPASEGIVFRRIDLEGSSPIVVNTLAVSDTHMASSIASVSPTGLVARVQTIEHLMSACAGLGIDNLLVDITAQEVPILDGSAASFVFLLRSAGIVEQEAARRFIKITQPIEVHAGEGKSGKWARLAPYDGYSLQFEIDFAHPAVDGTGQAYVFDYGSGQYSREIARARTFGFTRDVEMLRAHGLALGGGLDNAVVLDDEKILNIEGLRYDDEFVKHKILDAMGDLYVLGKPLLGAYSAYRSGHALNNQLLRALVDSPQAWEEVHFDDVTLAPAGFAQLPGLW